jgi:hypothetical protein
MSIPTRLLNKVNKPYNKVSARAFTKIKAIKITTNKIEKIIEHLESSFYINLALRIIIIARL